MKGADVAARMRLVLDDPNKTGWSDDELALWINDACLFVAVLRPDACVVNMNMALAAGPRQSIAALNPPGLRLLDVVYNVTTGRAMRLVPRQRLDTTNPAWYGASAAAPTDYCVDNRDPTSFYVYPPAQGTEQVNVVYSRVPVKIVAADLETVDLTPPDVYLDPIVNYCLFRAKSKEVEHAADAAAAAGYRQLAELLLTGKVASDRAFAVRANRPGDPPPPSGV